MSDRSPSRHQLLRLIAVIAAATGLLLSTVPVDAAWTRFHGDADNTGFVDVVTAPAGKGSRSVPGLGTFAPGSGPVIAPDGTVYLGTEEGKLIALHADGSLAWTHELTQGPFGSPNLGIVASPAVGADGSIYVIGRLKVRDHTTGGTVLRYTSELHKFTPGGGLVWHTRLPAGELGRGGNASSPPNIWQAPGTEAVMVSAAYSLGVTRLFAFSTEGVILAETVASRFNPGPAVGVFDPCGVPVYIGCFSAPPGLVPADPADRLPEKIVRPAPGPAVAQFSPGAPLVVVADQFQDVAGFSFSPTAGFIERFRTHDPEHFMRSSPIPLFGHTAVGSTIVQPGHQDESGGAIVFAGPSASKLPPVIGLSPILATPTRLADVRFVVLESRSDGSALLAMKHTAAPPRVSILSRTSLTGQSIAAPAASRTHVFVSTAGAFHSFDAGTMAEVGRLSWFGGGLSPPAIGPAGHVYAIASNILFIFPPPGGFGS
jgi:hypothetical protein